MIKRIGIIGAGVMGRGVAQVFSEHGFEVILVDNHEEALKEAEKAIYNSCRLSKFQNKNAENPEKILARIYFSNKLKEIEDSDFIVENITEHVDSKLKLYPLLDKLSKEGVILAANTSCISITKIAATTGRRENVLGVHFMNPVSAIPAVEVIRGFYTSEDTIQTTLSLLGKIDKEGIIVKDLPGFVANRISHLMMNEAAFIVQDQCAKVEDVDAIFRKCYGHKMGPLETADLIGLDTVVNSLEVLYDAYQDPKFRCCPLLKNMVDAGLLGRKTSHGFYKYY
ncbi:3-hydroxyacyl-CoA dehydrogenase family protein [Hungatella hathewayi]|uniref:3-hydroxyacyl-CoA dehydrogenase family protein n=1 Tax=Hungatella hathewayi TaxID=154046 RepID=UPI003562B56A